MSEVADFWSWVAQEKAKLDKYLKEEDEPPTLFEWLEQELAVAREKAFSLSIRQANGAEYWTGYSDALQDVLNAIRRREVRA